MHPATVYSEEATLHFYAWEQRGRGVLLAPEPAALEVQFVPYVHAPALPCAYDDGKRPTLLSRLASLISPPTQPPLPPEEEPVRYFPYEPPPELAYLTLTFPKEYRQNNAEMEQLLLLLSYCHGIVSFEIIATDIAVTFQFACTEKDEDYLMQHLQMLVPTVTVTRSYIDAFCPEHGAPTAAVDFGLKEEFMRPLATLSTSTIDPYTALFGILEYLRPNERCMIQILFSGTVNTWHDSVLHSLTTIYGTPFFPHAGEMLPAAKEKVSYPFFAVTIRLLVQGETNARTVHLCDSLTTAITHLSRSPLNSLQPLGGTEYSFEDRVDDIFTRSSRRLGMLLNSRELLTLVHFPGAMLPSKKLSRTSKKTKAVPSSILGTDYLLGINTHEATETLVRVHAPDRFKHTHIIGGTGTGKSNLLLHLMIQDASEHRGFAVLDPHGDLIDALIPHIPPHRQNDVVLIDPADIEYPFGLNILAPGREEENDILAGDVVSAFRRLSTSWGDQMNTVLYNALLAFFQNTCTGTLLDLRRFLIEKPFRDTWLRTITDPSIRYYWEQEFPLHKTSSIGPILTRLDAFLRPRQIRYMVAQKKTLDTTACIAQQQIILIKLAKGLIGADNSALLGSLMIAKLHQAAFAQQRLPGAVRQGFFLYIDEFQNFITPSLTELLSGARKYKLGLVLAHQDLQQLRKADTELESAVLSNAYTRICFRLAEADAKKMQEGMSGFESHDFQNLGTGEAIVRIGMPDHSFTLSTIHSAASPAHEQINLEDIRTHYGTKREEVEAYIAQMIQTPVQPPKPPKQKDPVPPAVLLPTPQLAPAPLPAVPIPVQASDPSKQDVDEVVSRKAKQKETSTHRYLQTLVKKLAESCGYKAAVEYSLPENGGRVDVHLEKEGVTIACEISVTTPTSWEVHNIQKCLAAGYAAIFCISTEQRFLQALAAAARTEIPEADQGKIAYLDPSNLIDYLTPAQQTQETVSKGYRVQVSYNRENEKGQSDKRQAIARIITRSIKKKK